MIKSLLVCITLAGLVIGEPARAQESPPPGDQAVATQALVTKAAALIEKDGKAAAFRAFRTAGSEWRHDDTYLFAYDERGNVLLNPAFPKREGMNVVGEKDVKGKPFQDDILKVAATLGSGWVSDMFPKPGQNAPSEKWVYIKKVTLDGAPGLIGSGFYP